MNAVWTKGLSKTYPGGKAALSGLDLALPQGEVFGFLGPNGAGKTTTIKLLVGMLTPTAGTCQVLGLDPQKAPEAVHAKVGVVTERAQMYDNLTGLENLLFFGRLYGLEQAEAKSRAMELLKEMALTQAKDQKLSAYSTGMRQRLCLARAFVHHPGVLFLDEPTSGLDPESAQNVNHWIKTLAEAEGVTVFLCTHQLRYAQEVCSRYGLMSKGRLLAEGTLSSLGKAAGAGSVLRICAHGAQVPYPKTGDGIYEIPIGHDREIPPIVREFVQGGGDIYTVNVEKPSLEDIYFALTATEKEETP